MNLGNQSPLPYMTKSILYYLLDRLIRVEILPLHEAAVQTPQEDCETH